ncbi:hypothetical protein LY90DRAFT_507126 [Neocallimastix californiae]|uniref:Ubiquitin carboxyl-terminal hydrolase 7 ICP0-binding domain-containing protein n=1 Tax=Neocallimastix californiae TaxID=1754190 RepID=A0A1Y2D7Z7_9FUNG|nr:hypothetical protein LY90DRAFT_507126 [Neocallimastix californiae]|eukprot:ORY55380.1 hypothetical protein LY90DRAFT_507126 [Neocallimastix californiae]
MDIYPNQCLIFLKYFDINEKKLMKVQKFTIDDTEKPLIHYAPLFNEIADLPINTPLNIYEETYPTMIDLLNQNHSFKKLEIVDGDILCFEKKLASEEEYDNIDKHLMIIPQYFEKLLSQKVVTFINVVHDNEPKLDDIELTLSGDTTYIEIANMLGERIQKNPENLQFITYSTHQQIRYLSNKQLDTFLDPKETILYYTILDITLKEYENIEIIQVDDLTAKYQVKITHNVIINNNSTYRVLFESIYKELGYELLRDQNGNYHCFNETFFDLKKRLLKKISLSNRELNEDNIYLINKESRLIKCDDDDVPDKYIAVGYDCPERTLMPLLSDKGLNINMKS